MNIFKLVLFSSLTFVFFGVLRAALFIYILFSLARCVTIMCSRRLANGISAVRAFVEKSCRVSANSS
jgi:hypothetical protein